MMEKELGALNSKLSEDQAFSFTKSFITLINDSFNFKKIQSNDSNGDTGSFSNDISHFVKINIINKRIEFKIQSRYIQL